MAELPLKDVKQDFTMNLDKYVPLNSPVRLIKAFVNGLDLSDFVLKGQQDNGRPAYPGAVLLMLFIYGVVYKVRSSYDLERAAKYDIECIWLMGGLQPNFNTINRFRYYNIGRFKWVFKEFYRKIKDLIKEGFTSVDGSKFSAWNSKDNNFTLSKLDDRIKRLDTNIDSICKKLDEADKKLTKEHPELSNEETEGEITEKENGEWRELLDSLMKRRDKYQEIRDFMEENHLSQVSLIDPDAKLMKCGSSYLVGYNVQAAVDSETHLIQDYNVVTKCTDHGQLYDTVREILKERSQKNVFEVTADLGYDESNDMLKCLENGVIPHVIPREGKESFEIEADYVSADDLDPTSTDPEELSKCLHAGVIPDAYKDVITEIEVKEVAKYIKEENNDTAETRTTEEMTARAKEGYFVKDAERDLVICPNGEILRPKCVKKNWKTRYCNKLACRKCPLRDKCCTEEQKYKEVDMGKDQLEMKCRGILKSDDGSKQKPNTRGKRVKKKIVRFVLKPKREITVKRKETSEHVFGTVKRALNESYLFLKGKQKVTGEIALFFLGYNIKRAMNLIGMEKLMKAMG